MKKKNLPKHKARKLLESEKLDLPVPRLEIRKYLIPGPIVDGYTVRADYSLVYDNLMGDHVKAPLGQTRIGADLSSYDFMDLPFRNGTDILNEMFVLKMRGFVVYGNKYQELFVTEDSIPNGLRTKMKKLGLIP